jgi:hypothetical protein
MKGISRSLGAMEIRLKPNAKPINRIPYLLNPKYKEKVKKELDRMLDVRIIVPVEEFDWVSPMVVKPKNTKGIFICVDLRILNATCINDSFSTPFTY